MGLNYFYILRYLGFRTYNFYYSSLHLLDKQSFEKDLTIYKTIILHHHPSSQSAYKPFKKKKKRPFPRLTALQFPLAKQYFQYFNSLAPSRSLFHSSTPPTRARNAKTCRKLRDHVLTTTIHIHPSRSILEETKGYPSLEMQICKIEGRIR